MSVVYRTNGGVVQKSDLESYIGTCFLDLVEEKPFYSIKVKELVEHAGLARSTFYNHFDSTFDVVQRMEDRFLYGFYPMETARQVLLDSNCAAAAVQSRYVSDNARMISLLTGPNGDTYFSLRLEKHIKDICYRIWAESKSSLSEEEKRTFSTYIAGGTVATVRLDAERALGHHQGNASREASRAIMSANRILLGAR